MPGDSNSTSLPAVSSGNFFPPSLTGLPASSESSEPRPIQWGTPSRDSLSGFAPTPHETAEGYAAAELCRVTDKIEHARDDKDLCEAARAAFGPENFSEGFIEAQRSSPNCKFHLELQRQMVRAELQDYLGRRLEWPAGEVPGSDFRGPELWQLGHHLRFARINLLCNQSLLKKAAAFRDALLADLTKLFTQDDAAWAPIRAQLAPPTFELWSRFAALPKSSRSEAGRLLGLITLAVLPLFAARNKTSTPSTRLAGTAPANPPAPPPGPA